jgi:hypothetical protein
VIFSCGFAKWPLNGAAWALRYANMKQCCCMVQRGRKRRRRITSINCFHNKFGSTGILRHLMLHFNVKADAWCAVIFIVLVSGRSIPLSFLLSLCHAINCTRDQKPQNERKIYMSRSANYSPEKYSSIRTVLHLQFSTDRNRESE